MILYKIQTKNYIPALIHVIILCFVVETEEKNLNDLKIGRKALELGVYRHQRPV